ncbi:MAG TPA: YqeG family HAD IIIA-type phosphatase [Candidatus Fimivicinus intestinavium]|nr:YqeG family HAD IIIA-type phosphatase [Candidatus Fimivicinus intestinavium]
MKNGLMPRYRVRRITDIRPEELQKLGIRGLALDIDNTIAYDSVNTFIEGVPEWLQEMRKSGMKMIIVSNALPSRARRISQLAGVPALGMSVKPMPFGFWRAAKRMGIRVSEMAVVGDQLLTDIRGGNLCGAVTIFVDPARKEERNVKIFESRRRREKPVLEAFDRLHPMGFYDLGDSV